MKKIVMSLALFFIFILGFFFYSSAIGRDNDKRILETVDQCFAAMVSSNPSDMSQIENPFKKGNYLMCKVPAGCEGTKQCILSQVLLDLLFSEVDVDIESYIDSLSSRKGDVALVKEVSDKFAQDSGSADSFANRYKYICDKGIFKYGSEYAALYKDENISLTSNNPFLLSSPRCLNLYKVKLHAYEYVANSKIQRNVINGYTADKKVFMKKIKDNWEKILTTFDRYIGKFGIIKDAWNKPTKKAQK